MTYNRSAGFGLVRTNKIARLVRLLRWVEWKQGNACRKTRTLKDAESLERVYLRKEKWIKCFSRALESEFELLEHSLGGE